MKTFTPKSGDIKEQWYVVDAEDQVLGRLAARIAHVLRGKNDPKFTPHARMQNHVIVVNADKVKLTGRKWSDKLYHYHSGWIGHHRSESAQHLHARKPTEVLRRAVRGMIPHTPLGNATMKNLRLYVGAEHQHQAQQPIEIKFDRT